MYHRRLKIMRPEDEAALRQREVGFLVELEVGNMRYLLPSGITGRFV